MSTDVLDFLDVQSVADNKADSLDFLPSGPSKLRSLISAPIKGLLKGAQDYNPLPSFGPISHKAGRQIIEKALPTQSGTAEDILEFTGENIPFALGGEGGLVKKGLQSLTGGLVKKGAKELGLPEWAQNILGGFGMSVPEAGKALVSKTLRPSSSQKQVVDFLRSKGLSEKEITPVIQDKKALSLLSKAAVKYEKKDPFIKGIKNKLGDVFEDIRERGRKSAFLQGPALEKFENEFYSKLNKIPRMYKGLIEKEVKDLFNNPINFTEIHDFNKAINAIVRDVEGGKAVVGVLKEPLEKAQAKLSPSLYKELKATNDAYTRLHHFTDKMTKKNWDSLLGLGEFGGAIIGALTLNPAMMKTAGLLAGGRITTKQLLTNPRLQNIHLKMWDALLKNKTPTLLKLFGKFNKELEDENQ